MKTPTLETKRLTLRPISLNDAPAIQKNFGHWEIIRYISNAKWPYPEGAAESYLQDVVLPDVNEGKSHVWAITLQNNELNLIGMIDYRLIAGENNDNRGFWLAIPHHGKGLMTEAVCAINNFVFTDLGVKRFRTRNVKGNIGSRRIKEKTGGTVIGEIEETLKNGNKEIMELWEVTKENWLDAKSKLRF